MIELVASAIIVVFIVLYLVWRYISKSTVSSPEYPLSFSEPVLTEEDSIKRPVRKNDFNHIIQMIEKEFILDSVTDEKDCEQQLISFLTKNFPQTIIRSGHTSQGVKIDIVIEGSYALELVLVTNEGRLVSLLNQMVKSTQDFGKNAVILVDIKKVAAPKLKEYIAEYERFGVKIILKNAE